jgi:hypothetical protein
MRRSRQDEQPPQYLSPLYTIRPIAGVGERGLTAWY